MRRLLSFLAVLSLVSSARAQDPSPAAASEPVRDVRVVFHTDKGDVDVTLYATSAPVTVASFLNLAQQHFYDGLRFHRVIPGFVAQLGDPTGSGSGGPGYQFEDEKNGDRRFDKAGVLAMANHGANTNGSQFFFLLGPAAHLNDDGGYGHYTIFGQVTKGQEVVDAITQSDHVKSVDILDPTGPLFAKEAEQIDKWNKQLTKPAKH